VLFYIPIVALQKIIMTAPPTDNSETKKEISSAVLSGTSLGRCLKMALDQVVSSTDNDDDDDDDGNDDPSATSSPIRLDKQAVDNIFNAFGSAAADTSVAASLEEETPYVTAATPPPPPHPAPRVLLQGRCKHYNRFGRYWSISIEDVKMKQRPTKFTQKRRGRRASMWDRDEEIVFDTKDQEGDAATTTADNQWRSNNNRQNVVSIDETIELMAYGDG
jgi:hypothetical protein